MIVPHDWIAATSAWWWPRVADHLWQATLFGLVVLAASLVLKRGPARVRHSFWLLASAKFFIPASLLVFLTHLIGVESLWFSLTNLNPGPTSFVLGITEPVSALANNYELTVTATAPGHYELYCALTGIWLAGGTALLVSWGIRRAKLRQALKQGRTVQYGREWLALKRAQKSLTWRGDVRLVISPLKLEPGVWGIWKPVILLPESIAEHLDDDELEAIMLHELVHVQRRDNLTARLQLALSALFWFHPLVWFISGKLFDEREQACDEKVLEIYGAPEAYASSILKVVHFSFGWKTAGVTGAGSGSNLQRRIENIMSTGNEKRKAGIVPRLLTATVVAIALVVLVVAGAYNRARSAGAAATEINGPTISGSFESINPFANPDRTDEKGRQSMRPRQTPPPPPQPANKAHPPAPASPVTRPSPSQPPNSAQPAQPAQPPVPPTKPTAAQEKSDKSRKDKQDAKKGELIEAPRPVYPEEARKQKIEGTVSVNIVIGDEGNVIEARATSGPELLQGAAKDAALKARFKPTLINGKAVKVSGVMTYDFVLDEKKNN